MAKKSKKEELKTVKKESKEAKKQSLKEIILDKKNRKYVYGIGIALLVIVVLLIVAVALKGNNDDEKEKPGKDGEDKVIVSDENTIKDEYGFSKEDAIAVVKKSYNSDNYEFSAKAREDNKYIVTVKNTETGSTYQYVVDPNDGSFSTLEN